MTNRLDGIASRGRAQLRKLLARQLERDEVRIVLAVYDAERKGQQYHAHLGVAASLQRRGWLTRDPDGIFHLSNSTRDLLAERGAA